MNEPEKLDLRSLDISEERKQELLRLFPEIRTEGGKIDFDRLQLALGESVDVGKERYGMHWPGKAECFKTIQTPSMATLIPAPKESVNFDTTENLIIEGDNLEVLKLLQKSYLGKVKMISIDPPYNTGNDFIYPDNYTESLQTYLEYTGQVDAEGRKFNTNADTDGRFHSKWMNMMYPRLYLARNLLRDDGLLFVSIDDHEQSRLISLCDEIFGEENFRGKVTRSTGTPTGQGNEILVNQIDYIVVYSKSEEADLTGLEFTDEDASIYDQEDERGRYLTRSLRKTGGEDRREDRPSMYYAIKGPDGKDVFPIGPGGYESRWRCGSVRYEDLNQKGWIEWKRTGESTTKGELAWRPYQKFYLDGRKKQPSNLWTDIEGNKKASLEVKDLMGGKVFDSPKPVQLIAQCISIGADQEGIILDFFAGSGTTAHAVLDLNKQDNGNRKFILVQLPEPTSREDYPLITDITKERVRRVIQKLNKEDQGKLALNDQSGQQDLGFKVFKLAESNFKPWNAQVEQGNMAVLEKQLDLHVDHIRDGRTSDDILYEILLKSGFPLTTPVKKITLVGKTIHSAADGALFICLEKELTLELIRAMAERKPARVVCLDEGFTGNDQLKANAVQIFKTKGVTSFKTV
ncbi:MAG: site-specific DNA-methyltransferase [Nitrospirae bacterium]|nr:site-specific DNA-methyltransferase [Nitrospirota bacterium]